jgi:hypothetical protein
MNEKKRNTLQTKTAKYMDKQLTIKEIEAFVKYRRNFF